MTWHSGSLCPVTLLACACPYTVVRSRSGQIRPLLQDNTPISVLHTHLCLSFLSCPTFFLWTLKRNQHAAFICYFFVEHTHIYTVHLHTHTHTYIYTLYMCMCVCILSCMDIFLKLRACRQPWEQGFSHSMKPWIILEKVVTVAASLQPLNWWIKTKTFRLIRVVRNKRRYLCFCAVRSVSSN